VSYLFCVEPEPPQQVQNRDFLGTPAHETKTSCTYAVIDEVAAKMFPENYRDRTGSTKELWWLWFSGRRVVRLRTFWLGYRRWFTTEARRTRRRT